MGSVWGAGAEGAQGTGRGDSHPEVPAPQLPPSPPQNAITFPHPTDEADRGEEATGDVPTFIPAVELASRGLFSKLLGGETSPEAILISLSLFQPSFCSVTVGRRTDKGMRVT